MGLWGSLFMIVLSYRQSFFVGQLFDLFSLVIQNTAANVGAI